MGFVPKEPEEQWIRIREVQAMVDMVVDPPVPSSLCELERFDHVPNRIEGSVFDRP
jgi:hypothetical protein